MKRLAFFALATVTMLTPAFAEGDASRGRQDFRACGPCHSLEANRNMTGPSLAGLWGRKAGSLPSFERFSDALKSSGIIWEDRSLDGWLTDPKRMVPDNDMPFDGIKDVRVRIGPFGISQGSHQAWGVGKDGGTARRDGWEGSHDGRNDGWGAMSI